MEGLFNERLQVRTRHLEERVNALTKQLACQKQDNARLLKSHSDATHKVQSLEEKLRSERERCHKLSATLSSFRRNVKKKALRCEEGNRDDYDSDPALSQLPGRNATIYYQCRQCGSTAPAHGESLKNDLLPNYMGIMPARLNHKLMKSKKTSKFSLNHHQNACSDGHVARRKPALWIDPSDHCQFCGCDRAFGCDRISCADGSQNVEIFLAHRLHPNDHVHQACSARSGLASHSLVSKRRSQNQHTPSLPNTPHRGSDHNLLQNGIAYKDNYCPSVPDQGFVDQRGIINTSAIITSPVDTKTVEDQDMQSLTTSAEGFYVRMQTAKVDNPQLHQNTATRRDFDSSVHHSDKHLACCHYHDSWSLRHVQALHAENNKALRDGLLSNKKVEVQELESELQDIKQCESGAPIPSSKKVNLSSDKTVTQSNDRGHTCNGTSDPNFIYAGSQVDLIKCMDSLHIVEDKISQKNVGILGLECGGAHMGDAARVDQADYLLSSDGIHMKALSTEDLRQLLKVATSEVVLLRQENLWLQQKCQGATTQVG